MYIGSSGDDGQHVEVLNIKTLTENSLTGVPTTLLLDMTNETIDFTIHSEGELEDYCPNWNPGSGLCLYSYLAVFESFRDLLRGSRNPSARNNDAWSPGRVRDRSFVLRTVLVETDEIYNSWNKSASAKEVIGITQGDTYDRFIELYGPTEKSPPRKSLLEVLPDLFQNATISLASVPSLRLRPFSLLPPSIH